MIPVETTIVDPVIGVKAHENLQSEPEMSLPAPEQKVSEIRIRSEFPSSLFRSFKENYVTTEDSETQPPSNLPSKILKSEPNVSSVVSTNASSQPDISPGFIAPEPIQDYDEWTKRKLEEQHRTKIADIHSNTGGPSHHHHGNVVPRVAARNYAAGECNAKVLLFNKEAKNAKSILNGRFPFICKYIFLF